MDLKQVAWAWEEGGWMTGRKKLWGGDRNPCGNDYMAANMSNLLRVHFKYWVVQYISNIPQ